MPTITEVSKDRVFYKNFSSLIQVLKTIAGSQFQASEKKIHRFYDLTNALEGFLRVLDLKSVDHPMVTPNDLPLGIVVVTSDAGLMGGVNYRLMTRAIKYAREQKAQLIVVGSQGQKFVMKTGIPVKNFPGVIDDKCFEQAQTLSDYILAEIQARRLGTVKILFPYAASIASQHIIEWDFFPCTLWNEACLPGQRPKPPIVSEQKTDGMIMESEAVDIIEYVSSLWIRQKLFEIFQSSRVAEFAARIIHLEESTHRVKEIEHKLKLKYFRIHHSIIDQQMRELFTARSLYA